MASVVRDQIIDEIKESVYFSVMADESKDISKKEQISLVLRFYSHKQINECFMEFKPASGLDAMSLANSILESFQSYGLDVASSLVGQGYDGASVMSGCNAGVQQRIREHAPLAHYVHCYAHRLNLILVDCCKSVAEVRDFFALLERLYVFVSGSSMHLKWIEMQNRMFPGEPVRQLQKLSDTRWACRVIACRNIRDRLGALKQLLEEISDDRDSDRAVEARGLLAQLDFKFVLVLHFACKFLGMIQILSAHLQSPDVDLGRAVSLLDALREELQDLRNNVETAEELFSAAEKQCADIEISITFTAARGRRRRQLPDRLQSDSAFVETSVGHREEISNRDVFRIEIILPVIDCLMSELNRRFSDQACAIMQGIQALNPSGDCFLNIAKLDQFAKQYDSDLDDFHHELHQLDRMLQRNKAKEESSPLHTLLDLVRFLEPFAEAFHETFRLAKIAIILPASSASCERSFSTMKLIKTYLRNSMGDRRLSNLALLSVESTRTQNLDLNIVVDEFDARHKNRNINLH